MINIHLQQHDPRIAAELPRSPTANDGPAPFGSDGLTFSDFVDLVNPLQHIPVVGSIYRKLTGDQIDPAARIGGGALFGGPIGAALSAAAVLFGAARDRNDTVEKELPNVVISGEHQKVANTRETQIIGARQWANVAELAVNVPQPRRGGWIVAQAYGPPLPQSTASTSPEPKLHIDVAV